MKEQAAARKSREQQVGDLAVGVKSSIVIKEGLCEGW
jgi:hypothetical protein